LQVREASGVRVLDDSYNANPGSVAAALAVLAAFPGARWLVLGDMGELGASAEDYHRQVGQLAREAGVERLFAVGRLAGLAAEGFGAGASQFPSHQALIESLRREASTAAATLLVKGSRSMTMERVVEALVGAEG
jgi:UDP-N-acetylmuramoyl-tripeptide--D-alanyl-D-alanine ligase